MHQDHGGVQLIGMESGSRWHGVIIWSLNKPLIAAKEMVLILVAAAVWKDVEGTHGLQLL